MADLLKKLEHEPFVAVHSTAVASAALYALRGRRAFILLVILVGAWLGVRDFKLLHLALAAGGAVLLDYFLGAITTEGFRDRSPRDGDDDDDSDGEPAKQPAPKRKKGGKRRRAARAPAAVEEDFEDAHVDLGTTFLNSYKELDPKQVDQMRSDTRELMETQELMTVLSDMGPAVQQGVGLIENFKKYFGGAGGGALPGGADAGLLAAA